MKFIKNKYYRWYYQIIDKARKRGVPDEYYERHHIIPECLGGTDSEFNLVELTFREHYLVHWFLIKMTAGETKRKMLHALFMMNGISSSNQGRKSPSWLYTLAKKAAKEARLGYKYSEEAKIKMSESARKRKPISEETRTKLKMNASGEKNNFYGKKHSAEIIERVRKGNLGRKQSEETKMKKSIKLKGRKDSEETRLKKSGKNHPMYGKTHTVEAREKIRIGLYGKNTGKDNHFYGKKHKVESLVTMRKEPSIRNKLGLRGVSKTNSGYSARIRLNGKVEFLGRFKTSDEAVLAYKTALSRIEGVL